MRNRYDCHPILAIFASLGSKYYHCQTLSFLAVTPQERITYDLADAGSAYGYLDYAVGVGKLLSSSRLLRYSNLGATPEAIISW